MSPDFHAGIDRSGRRGLAWGRTMITLKSIALGLGLMVLSAHAADLSGTWRIDTAKRGGVVTHTYFVLQQKGRVLTGKVVINGAVDLPLRNPKIEGSDATFSMDWGNSYRVHPEGNTLKVAIRWGTTKTEATAIRVPQAEANPPPSQMLPAMAVVRANGLAATPPMGWSSWNHFGDGIDDADVRGIADALAGSGLAKAGYVYVNIDDGWEGGRDAAGNIVPNAKFPNMKALADYVHSRGLKLGLYSSPGPLTCGGYEGSFGHEDQDARTFASWGVDYLKYDWCSAARVYSDADLEQAYQWMGQALARCGRPIVYSLCEYGMRDVWTWGPRVGANLWRTAGDIQDNWRSMSEIGFDQSRLAPYAGPGHWNDPDMLEVGNGGMTATEYRTHFSLWCMLAAPLILGNDVRTMAPDTLAMLSNREVIAIDQDPLGRQGRRVASSGGIEVWTKPLADGGEAVAVFNRNDREAAGSFTWAQVGFAARPGHVRDLWAKRDLAPAGEGLAQRIPAHGMWMLRLGR